MSEKIIPFVRDEDGARERVKSCGTMVYRFTNEGTGEVIYNIEIPQRKHLVSCAGCYQRVINVLLTRGFEADYSDPTMVTLRGRDASRTVIPKSQQISEKVEHIERQTMFQLSQRLNYL